MIGKNARTLAPGFVDLQVNGHDDVDVAHARDADWSHLWMANVGGACEGVSAAARVGFGGFIAAMLGALWAYDGWNNVTLVAGEVQNPHRNLPRALIGDLRSRGFNDPSQLAERFNVPLYVMKRRLGIRH